MTWLLKEFLSFLTPDRRWSRWHCSGFEVICVFALYLLLPAITMPIVLIATNSNHKATQEEQAQTDNQNDDETVSVEKPLEDASEEQQLEDGSGEKQLEDKSHPLIRLLKRRNWTDFAMVFYMACILAPLNEELLFRGCLQNWLHGLFARLYIRRRVERWRVSFMSVVIPALLFALIHFRTDSDAKISLEKLHLLIINGCVALTALPVILLGYLFFIRKLRFRDIFGNLQQIPDLFISGAKWIWILVVCYALMISVSAILSHFNIDIVVDPIGLLPLALVFGYLYYRTQSILPSIALHFLFNFSSLCMVLPIVL